MRANSKTGSELEAKTSKFWFEDGTVVLVADVEGVEFRVYKGPLADHSPVLGDMFMFSGEDDGDDEHDGENREGEDVDANSNAASKRRRGRNFEFERRSKGALAVGRSPGCELGLGLSDCRAY